ncbi:helix-turn-helix domain-containing protein [Clostridium botulinum]|uniref:Helix-turn-helix transcriptional regulator n=1 Tax=Clostridium botulinum TaxID=1491 RepID=A0ABD7CM53_CLOBO|nr:XRE family transcriptional regulator [Clostridium botulinum]KGO15066.1 DNA-binding protein [Clostridium botulinum]KIN81916.1 DNA-binding protein [Clostridium botulinum]MCC5427415.1 XRE family transcriptional regulator [Clostridium botulinum]QRI54438.1 helix-turn-helix transcriptional regulator [Clostridium botulinum]
MKDFNSIIGRNLNNIRKQKNMSLDKVAELTGVSKAMLAQIEKGRSNPTVSTLWKIATGLNVSFSYFMEEDSEIIHVCHNDIKYIVEDNSKMRVYPLFPYDNTRKFEMFTIELDSGCNHQSLPHNEGTEEYIVVTRGKMEVVIEDSIYKLSCGDAIRYFANKLHCYRNSTNETVCFQHIIYYFK